MEEIIGLLIIIAVSIFKAVNKKLEKSGRQNKPGKTFPPAMPATEREAPAPEFDIKGWIAEAIKEAEAELNGKEEPEEAPAPIEVAPVIQTPVMPEPPVKQAAPAKPTAPVEEKKPEKEKIDPKKLIIYSEIMTPKCMNNN